MAKAHFFVKVIFFLCIFAIFLRPFDGNGDFYHHVNTGRLILETHSIPHSDIFSHTAFGQPWVAHAWLSGIIFYLIFQNFGGVGISLTVALTGSLTLLLLYFLLKSYGFSEKSTIYTIIISALVILIRWPQRPEIFYYPLLILILLIDQLKKRRKNLTLAYPFIILLWVNLYGGAAIVGLGMIALLSVRQFYRDHFKFEKSQTLFYITSLVSFPISLINGYGIKSLLYLYFFIPKVSLYEGEWAGIVRILTNYPLSFLITYQYLVFIFLAYFLAVVFVLVLSYKNIIKSKFFLLLSLGIFIPFWSLRHSPLAAILVAPLLALLIEKAKFKRLTVGIILVASLFILGLNIWITPPGIIPTPNPALDNMISFIQKNNITGKAFNHTHFGAFLTYKLFPKVLVFYDTRDEVYLNSPALKDLYNYYSSGQSVVPLLDKYKIDLVTADIITDGLNYHDLFYSEKWAVVYFDDRYFVAIPRSVALTKNLAIIDSVDPFSPTKAKPGLDVRAVNYYQKILKNNPDSFNDKINLATALLSIKDYSSSIKILNQISVSSSPISKVNKTQIDDLLARDYLGVKDCPSTLTELNKTIENSKGIIILKPQETLSSEVGKTLAFYYLVCAKDKVSARSQLDLYLDQPSISPLDKIKTENEFAKLEKSL